MNSWFTVSPLNYIGGKARILDQLLPVFPEHISTFVDLFCGGCNVGINTQADNYIYNDGNRELVGLLKMFLRLNTKTILKRMDEIVEHYGFSKTKDHNFAYYGGNPMKGVSRYNKEPFLLLRQDYNNSPRSNQHYIMLYALVVFGFNNQMRFNYKGEYNLPVGKRYYREALFMIVSHDLICSYHHLSRVWMSSAQRWSLGKGWPLQAFTWVQGWGASVQKGWLAGRPRGMNARVVM